MKTKTNPHATRNNSTRLTNGIAQRASIYFAALFCFALLSSVASAAISATTYPFTTSSGAVLEDLSSGATTIVSSGQDDSTSAIADMGFDFWFDGVRFSQ